jgi:hypothetical protein
MDMLGHEDEGDQPEVVTQQSPVQALRETSSPVLIRQKGHPTKAGEGELMTITGFMASADCLVLCAHAGTHTIQSTGEQVTSATELYQGENWGRGDL